MYFFDNPTVIVAIGWDLSELGKLATNCKHPFIIIPFDDRDNHKKDIACARTLGNIVIISCTTFDQVDIVSRNNASYIIIGFGSKPNDEHIVVLDLETEKWVINGPLLNHNGSKLI